MLHVARHCSAVQVILTFLLLSDCRVRQYPIVVCLHKMCSCCIGFGIAGDLGIMTMYDPISGARVFQLVRYVSLCAL